MSRYAKKELPDGFIIREYADGTFQAYRENEPSVESPRYTRRRKAVDWCLIQIGKETTATTATTPRR